ncbi:hypothetical protein KUTeg_024338, partial [Tegillarca granosa]
MLTAVVTGGLYSSRYGIQSVKFNRKYQACIDKIVCYELHGNTFPSTHEILFRFDLDHNIMIKYMFIYFELMTRKTTQAFLSSVFSFDVRFYLLRIYIVCIVHKCIDFKYLVYNKNFINDLILTNVLLLYAATSVEG